MNPAEYFILALKHGCHRKIAWIVSAFSVTNETEEQRRKIYPFKLSREPYGYYFYNEAGEKIQIAGKFSMDKPLFNKYDKITLNASDFPYIMATSIETTYGRALLNMLLVFEPFQGKLGYINQRFDVRQVEKMITGLIVDDPKNGSPVEEGKIPVAELIKLQKANTFVEALSSIFALSATREGMLPPPGRKEFKQKLLDAYKGKLTNPIEMAHFQEELRAFDIAYLKANDPSYGKFMAGKVIDARGKAFLTQGGESNEFINQLDVTPIIGSLDEGIDLTPEAFVAVANTIRYGSFARGAETVNGGVVAKGLMTALDTWRIVDKDCGSTLGVTRQYSDDTIHKLVGRYILVDDKPLLIETIEEAKQYVDKVIFIRSQQYCRRPGTETCAICAGKAVAQYKNGQVITTMEVSSGIMNDSLKKMHNTSITTATLDLKSVLS